MFVAPFRLLYVTFDMPPYILFIYAKKYIKRQYIEWNDNTSKWIALTIDGNNTSSQNSMDEGKRSLNLNGIFSFDSLHTSSRMCNTQNLWKSMFKPISQLKFVALKRKIQPNMQSNACIFSPFNWCNQGHARFRFSCKERERKNIRLHILPVSHSICPSRYIVHFDQHAFFGVETSLARCGSESRWKPEIT